MSNPAEFTVEASDPSLYEKYQLLDQQIADLYSRLEALHD
jgi:hypothetical protein